MSAIFKCGLNSDLSLNPTPTEGSPSVDVTVTVTKTDAGTTGSVAWAGQVQGFLSYSSEGNKVIGVTPVNQDDAIVAQSLSNIMNVL